MRGIRFVLAAALGATVAACAPVPDAPTPVSPARIERIDATTARITLDPQTVARMGIVTVPLRTTAAGATIPYSALIYDTAGKAFVYTNPAPFVFLRHAVVVKQVEGDLLFLTDGPGVGVPIVTVGAGQLLGIELGIGE